MQPEEYCDWLGLLEFDWLSSFYHNIPVILAIEFVVLPLSLIVAAGN